MTPSRMFWQNFATLGASVITASSSTISFPVRRLRDALRSNRWRSATGWTIVAGFNDKIDFNRGGDKTATLTAGTYATGDAMAAAILAALEAADATPVWACSYSASTFKFTISSDTSFVLEWLTGANTAKTAALDLGFTVADSTSGTSFTGANASYQSRHYVAVDIGSTQDVKIVIASDHNAETGGTFTIGAGSSAANALLGASYSATLDNTENKATHRVKVPASTQSYRYWALVINDVQNADGFSELGLLYLGEYLELDLPARGLPRKPVDYSANSFADQGANYQDRKQRTRSWEYSFEALAESKVLELDRAATQLLTGGCFFFQRDPEADAGGVVYVLLLSLPDISHNASSADLWDATLNIQEALG